MFQKAPEEYEHTSDISSSEMSFYNTPLTEKYYDQVYGAIQNIQGQCAADYQRVCPSSKPYLNLNYLMSNLIGPAMQTNFYRGRKLTERRSMADFKSGAELVDYLRSFYSVHTLPDLFSPLASVMYRSEKTSSFVSPSREAEGKKALRTDKGGKLALNGKPRSYAMGASLKPVHLGDTHRSLRQASPGWKMPSVAEAEAARKAKQEAALKNAQRADAAHGQNPHQHHVPKSDGSHHSSQSHSRSSSSEEHRRGLRMAAPGWVMPAAASNTDAAAVDMPAAVSEGDEPRPFPKPCNGNVAHQVFIDDAQDGDGSFAMGRPLADFRRFVLDFLNGKDVAVSLVGRPYALGEGGGARGFVDFVEFTLPNFAAGDDSVEDDGAYYSYYDDDDSSYYSADDDDADDAAYYADDSYYADDAYAYLADDGEYSPYYMYYADDDDTHWPDLDDSSSSPRLAVLPRAKASLRPAVLLAAEPIELDREDHDGRLRADGGSSEEGDEGSTEAERKHRSDDHWGFWPAGSKSSSTSSSSSESAEERIDHHGHHPPHSHDHHPEHPRGPPPPEDRSFQGSLGFGSEGDLCLYRGMAEGQVSEPCIGAVADLYQLRSQYWEESQQSSGPHCHGFVLVLVAAVLLLGCLVRKWYARHRAQKVRSLLTALHTNPSLKATVEAETGVPVPMPRTPGSCCSAGDDTQSPCSSPSGVKRFLKVTAFFVCLLAVSFLVSFTALEATMHIVHGMDMHAEEDAEGGEAQYTSPVVALSILLLVCTAEVAVLALIVRGLKACCAAKSNESEASAASGYPGVSTATAPTPATWVTRYAQRVADRFGRGGGGAHDGYARLPGGDEYAGDNETLLGRQGSTAPLQLQQGTEMVSVASRAPTAPPLQQARAVPQQLQQQYTTVLVPVTAMPVNSISMV